MKRVVESDAAPGAIGPYSQAIAAGGMLYVSGQIGLDPATGLLVAASIEEETRRVLENVGAILSAAGVTTDAVVRTTVYLTNLTDFPRVNQVYAEFFRPPFPARATVQVAALPRGARVEIDAVAVVRE